MENWMGYGDVVSTEWLAKIVRLQEETTASWMAHLAQVVAATPVEPLIPSIDIPKSVSVDLRETVKRAVREMALRGWTLQMNLTLGDIDELASTTVEETDEFFVNYYTQDEFAALRKVREEFQGRLGLARWRALLDQCFDAFERGDHLITIPALLSVTEGVIASAGQALTNPRARLIEICRENSKKNVNSITAAMWDSLGLFIERLFQKAPFDSERPASINRHWILHGRDSANWTVADALRLFNALQTVDSLLD